MTDRDVERTAVRILGLLGGTLIAGLTVAILLRPSTDVETEGAFAVLGAVIGAIGSIAASKRS